MTDGVDFPPADVPRRRPRPAGLAALKRQLDELREERAGLLERCQIAEAAACRNLQYAQAAREAMEELAERILARLPLSSDKTTSGGSTPPG